MQSVTLLTLCSWECPNQCDSRRNLKYNLEAAPMVLLNVIPCSVKWRVG